jgi:hypothetical protein
LVVAGLEVVGEEGLTISLKVCPHLVGMWIF